jgi:hypothetical protein
MKLNERIKAVGCEQTQESLAMLKLLAQSQRSVEAGKHKPLKKAFADLVARLASEMRIP